MTPTNKETDSIRSDLYAIRDKISLFQMKDRNIDINSGYYDIVCRDVIKASMDVEDAIHALNTAIAKKE